MLTISPTAPSRAKPSASVLLPMNGLISVLYAMMLAEAVFAMPVWGCALAVFGQMAVLYSRLYAWGNWQNLPNYLQKLGPALLGIALALALLLMLAAPGPTIASAWMLISLTCVMAARGILGERVLHRAQRNNPGGQTGMVNLVLVHGMAGLGALLALRGLGRNLGWAFAGYALESLVEGVFTWKSRRNAQPMISLPEAQVHRVRGIRAYRAYQRIYLLILMILQATQIMVYVFIGVSYEQMITCLAILLVCTALAYGLAIRLLRRALHQRDALNILGTSLFLWLIGMLVFSSHIQMAQPTDWRVYSALSLCTAGMTGCLAALSNLEQSMPSVIAFGAGEYDRETLLQLRSHDRAFANLAGQLLALCGMVVWCFITRRESLPQSLNALQTGFRLSLVLPLLMLALYAAHAIARFPLTQRHLEKLQRYLNLKQEGKGNAPLFQQLEQVLLGKTVKRYGLKVLAALARPLFYHRITGRENVHIEEEGSAIFLCNHGELYGPVVTNLYVPFSFRPWSISEMTSPEQISEFVYRTSFRHQRWIPKALQMPLAKLLSPLFLWVMRSIECIPVYRGCPGELRKTFRDTIQAMQAGDNILIFPENPDAASLLEPGYLHQGVGEISSGFAMLGHLYHTATGKRATFIPIYASKKRRTLSFGQSTQFNPNLSSTEERERLMGHILGEMQRMAGELDGE